MIISAEQRSFLLATVVLLATACLAPPFQARETCPVPLRSDAVNNDANHLPE